MLEMKQQKVAERKREVSLYSSTTFHWQFSTLNSLILQELEKRFARSRMSRKDRLRKEIQAARELQSNGEIGTTTTETFGYSRLQEETHPIQGRGGERQSERERNGYDNSAHVEGDTTYNAEESGGKV